MFLALREMRYSKLRYALVIGIMLLIAYVVFMLSGLARGLSEEFKQAIDAWDAKEIVLSKEANKSLNASQMTRESLEQVSGDSVPIGIYSGSVKSSERINITLFGTSNNAFLLPKLIDGKRFEKENEIIISKNLADEGYKIGDKIQIGNYEQKLTIVGIFPESYYSTTPVIYSDLNTWTHLKYGDQPYTSDKQKPINAIVTKNSSTLHDKEDLEKLTIPNFIENIPGYSAQNLTLNAMVYFLFVIVAAVIGIFMYVITLQKTTIFGVMKAQGIRNSFIAKSLIAQSFFVGIIGVGLALLLAFLTSLILPSAMPFAIDWAQWLLYSLILIGVAVLGGLFSIRTIAKVDPITAIGG